MFGSLEVLIWADVAPKSCQILRRYVEKEHHFRVEHTVGRSTDANGGVARCFGRKKQGSGESVFAVGCQVVTDVEQESKLWADPQSVLLGFGYYGPQLLISNRMLQPLLGQQPSIKLTEDTTGERSPFVVGKVISSSREFQETFHRILSAGISFKCSIVQTTA